MSVNIEYIAPSISKLLLLLKIESNNNHADNILSHCFHNYFSGGFVMYLELLMPFELDITKTPNVLQYDHL